MQARAINKVVAAVSQRTSSGGSLATRTIATAIGLPSQGPIHMPTVDIPRSSCTVLTDELAVYSPSTPFTGWSTGDTIIAFFGQPGRLAMIWQNGLPTGTVGCYLQSGSGPVTSTTISYPSANPVFLNYAVPILGAYSSLGVVTPHGITHCSGRQADVNYIWLNASDTINIVVTPSYATGTGNINWSLVRYTGPNSQPVVYSNSITSLPVGASTLSATPGSQGYYAVRLDTLNLPAGTAGSLYLNNVTIVYNSTVGWRQLSMMDLDPNSGGDVNMVEEARVNACSMLCTNVTSMLNRQGTVLAARVRQLPFWRVTPSILGRAAEKYQGDAAHGCYTFFELSDVRATFTNHNNDFCATFDLDYNDYYHFVQLTCATPLTTANNYAVKFDTMLEFKTDIARYEKRVSNYNYQDLIAARRVINSQPVWFYENPTHAQQIYGFIKKLAGGAWKAGKIAAPYALKALAVTNPELAPLFKLLSIAV
jgi:hypothetical protein